MEDPEPFDRLVAQLDSPMAVVTTAAGHERAGCLIGFHCQCSIHPRRYALWLSKANHTFRTTFLADHLAVHLLGEDDGDLAELFGTLSGDDIDKFRRCDWAPGPSGVPLLERCPNRIVVRKVALHDDGSDHVCVVTEPVAAESGGPFRPLRLSQVDHLTPGHEVDDRPRPPTTREGGPTD